MEIELTTLSRKLYPCCSMTHRMIAAAITARETLAGQAVPDDAAIEVNVPYGTMHPLHVLDPRTGLEAKFCAAYTVATGLAQGAVGLTDFEDEAVQRPEIRRLMAMVTVNEESLAGEMPVGMNHGRIAVQVCRRNRWLAEGEAVHYPRSPEAPPTRSQMEAKVLDCLARYRRKEGSGPTLDSFRNGLRRQFGLAEAGALQ